MAGIRDMETQELILKAAEALEKMPEMKPPAWAQFVKTGVSRERPPAQHNWWWIRSASLLRRIYLDQKIGVSRLRKKYGGRKNRGHKPEHKYPASGKIIRKILQQLEAAGYVKTEKGKGRLITPKGQQFLDRVAKGMKK
ncbi:MAG: 30S ribosomal protein S19e [Candidatus Aenigmarchaeota archaeon]|nr:30S ribosomal protein S19e [Candidatus Aenigmarchaeota archaeon]